MKVLISLQPDQAVAFATHLKRYCEFLGSEALDWPADAPERIGALEAIEAISQLADEMDSNGRRILEALLEYYGPEGFQAFLDSIRERLPGSDPEP